MLVQHLFLVILCVAFVVSLDAKYTEWGDQPLPGCPPRILPFETSLPPDLDHVPPQHGA